MRVLVIVGASLVALSCRPPVTITNEVRDSVIVRETVRLDTVTLPGDTVRIAGVIVECDSVTNRAKPLRIVRARGSAALSVTISPGGVLSGTGGCDSLRGIIEIKDKEIERLTSRQTTIVKPPEYRTRGIDIFCRCFTTIVLLAAVGIVGLKLKGLI